MAKVLIVYGTVEGQTRKIAEHISDRIGKLGHSARLFDAAHNHGRPPNAGSFDAIIVAAPVHMGRHHQAVVHFVKEHAGAFRSRPGAFVSVSLSVIGKETEDWEATREYVDKFVAETGWMPYDFHHAAGALRFTKYDFFKRWMMRRIAREHGLNARPGEDVEFTDWETLDGFVAKFLAQLTSKPRAKKADTAA